MPTYLPPKIDLKLDQPIARNLWDIFKFPFSSDSSTLKSQVIFNRIYCSLLLIFTVIFAFTINIVSAVNFFVVFFLYAIAIKATKDKFVVYKDYLFLYSFAEQVIQVCEEEKSAEEAANNLGEFKLVEDEEEEP